MNCPVCKETKLLIADRNGIEIDYCPDCRGIWLDRGELDKIIERSQSEMPERRVQDYERKKHHDDDYHKYDYKKKKRGGFLEDLFDF